MFSKNLMPYYPVQTDRCGKRQNGDIRRYDSVVVRFWCILLRDDSEGIEMRTEWVDHPSFVLDHAGENDMRPLAGWLVREQLGPICWSQHLQVCDPWLGSDQGFI